MSDLTDRLRHVVGEHPMTPTFGSLFAGVGGFDLGLERAGWQCGFQVEWDTNCQAVLARHWPDVPRWGDVSDVDGATLPPVDLITFGSPCQDLSVAGKRAGLDGARSGLFFEAIRIIEEMRDATDHEFPRWAIWENVVGALSSNGGADFGAVLDSLADAGSLVIEWVVLDARWFGVPQRRRRVFVVACFDPAIECPDPLLPVAARSCWHPPTSQQAGSPAPATATGSFDGSGISPAVISERSKPGTDQVPTIAFHPTQTPISGPVSPALGTTSGGIGIAHAAAVRRLTPLECERLMGWPDDHTRWRSDGTEQSDTARYKQCGNGVVSNVAEWIGRHILIAAKTAPRVTSSSQSNLQDRPTTLDEAIETLGAVSK